MIVAPSLNVTPPEGVPPAPVTVAANVTAAPPAAGFGVAVSDVVEAVLPAVAFTAWANAGDVLPVKFVSPI